MRSIFPKLRERFLELPPVIVLAVLWLGGVAFLGLLALALYLVGTFLVRALAGS